MQTVGGGGGGGQAGMVCLELTEPYPNYNKQFLKFKENCCHENLNNIIET